LPRPISLQPFNFRFFLSKSVNLKSVLPNACQIHSVQLCIHCLFISLTLKFFCCYNWLQTIRCSQIELLIISTFPISSLTEFMSCFTCSRLHGLSPSALDSLTLNFSYTETSTEVDVTRYLLELYSYITYCVSEHRCLVPVHLGSVCMMRMLTLTVIICTEQIV